MEEREREGGEKRARVRVWRGRDECLGARRARRGGWRGGIVGRVVRSEMVRLGWVRMGWRKGMGGECAGGEGCGWVRYSTPLRPVCCLADESAGERECGRCFWIRGFCYERDKESTSYFVDELIGIHSV